MEFGAGVESSMVAQQGPVKQEACCSAVTGTLCLCVVMGERWTYICGRSCVPFLSQQCHIHSLSHWDEGSTSLIVSWCTLHKAAQNCTRRDFCAYTKPCRKCSGAYYVCSPFKCWRQSIAPLGRWAWQSLASLVIWIWAWGSFFCEVFSLQTSPHPILQVLTHRLVMFETGQSYWLWHHPCVWIQKLFDVSCGSMSADNHFALASESIPCHSQTYSFFFVISCWLIQTIFTSQVVQICKSTFHRLMATWSFASRHSQHVEICWCQMLAGFCLCCSHFQEDSQYQAILGDPLWAWINVLCFFQSIRQWHSPGCDRISWPLHGVMMLPKAPGLSSCYNTAQTLN